MFNWLLKLTKKSKTPIKISNPGFNPKDIDPDALKVINRLVKYGYKAYLVGGAVRDLVLGVKPKDFDVATSANPNEIKAVFRNSIIIGKRFRLVHVRFKNYKFIETATFRKHHGQDQNSVVKRDNVFGTEKEDAFRRDFTLNAMFYDVVKDEIVDYTGGLKDLKRREICSIGTPEIRLTEDPVRILRAIKFSAKYNLSIDRKLEEGIVNCKDKIKLCSARRLFEEFVKIALSGHLEVFIKKSLELNFLESYLPFLSEYHKKNPAIFFRVLKECDKYALSRGSESYFIFCILFLPLINERNRIIKDFQTTTHEIFQKTNKSFPITKAEKMQMRALFILLQRLDYAKHAKPKKRMYLLKRIFKSPFTNDTLKLFKINESILTGDNREYKMWKEELKRFLNPKPANSITVVSKNNNNKNDGAILRRKLI